MKALSILLSIISLAAVSTQAGVSSNFSDLREELAFRREVLGGSENKAEQQQDKACLKGITIIDKITNLSGDIKASFKLGKLLEKAFPNEFQPLVTGGVIFTNNLLSLVLDGYQNIGGQLDDSIEATQLNINLMPEGKDRDKAQAALDIAFFALADAEEAFIDFNDYKATTKLFGVTLKSLRKAQKIIGMIL